MITCQQLDGFTDQLCDLTRDGNPVDLAVEATELIGDNPVQRFLMQHRAAAAADAHYLEGTSLAKIARACGKTPYAASLWLQEYGPRHYLTIGEEDDRATHGGRRLVLRLMKVEADDQAMKRKVRELRAAGVRIVPARFNLVDPAQPDGWTPGIDAKKLWSRLA